MYLPAHFEETRPELLHALLRAHPLGTWVSQRDGELAVEHVPFLFDADRGEHGTLIGHVARANPVWRQLSTSVVVFQGPQAYVSPAWYPGKPLHGKVVPTWNYAVVHAHGRPRAIEDAAGLLQIVNRLTDAHEAGRAQPWQVADAPADYIAQMLGAIVGIEIPIDRLVGKWKVSQNRSAADRAGVAAGLLADGSAHGAAMASLVTPATPAASG